MPNLKFLSLTVNEKLKYALLLAFVLNSAFVLSNFQERTFDSYEHIFFADHYRRSWFDTWETKWYGGFTVTSYPPLAHQTIALLSYLVGLEGSYKILTLALMTILPLAVYFFSKVFVEEKAAIYAAFLSVFLPSLLEATYAFGQFPTLFGLIAGLFAFVYLNKYLLRGSLFDLIIALGLLGVSVSAHHFTAVFLVPSLVIVLILTMLLGRKEMTPLVLFKRVLLFGVLGIGLCLAIIYPYWYFALFGGVEMTPIPHLTRANIFLDSFGFELFFWNIYGPILFLIPFFFVLAWRNRKLVPLCLGAIVLFAIGLGGTTPLPQLIFGQFWEWLTYDRFALWASVMFLPLSGQLFVEYRSRFGKKTLHDIAVIAFLVVLISSGAFAANRSLNGLTGYRTFSVDPAVEFLNSPQTQDWRYLTLGLGEAQMVKLSVYANASNVDGYYFFVRSDPLLAKSGIGALDSAKFFGEEGLDVLGEILGNASKYSLRWVFCADPTYYQVLSENGFIERWSQDSTGDSRLGGLTVWEYSETPPVYVPNNPQRAGITISDYVWGIGPPLVLFVTILLLIIGRIRKIGPQ